MTDERVSGFTEPMPNDPQPSPPIELLEAPPTRLMVRMVAPDGSQAIETFPYAIPFELSFETPRLLTRIEVLPL